MYPNGFPMVLGDLPVNMIGVPVSALADLVNEAMTQAVDVITLK